MPHPPPLSAERIENAYRQVREALLRERTASGHWEGELSTSALATATAVMALELVRQAEPQTVLHVIDAETLPSVNLPTENRKPKTENPNTKSINLFSDFTNVKEMPLS